MVNNYIEQTLERFDNKFGKAYEEELEDIKDVTSDLSHRAGCDGCTHNIYWREESRKLLRSSLTDLLAKCKEAVPEEKEMPIHNCSPGICICSVLLSHNACREQTLDNLSKI